MGMKKKKILFIIWSYTYGGGAEALLTMIVNHLNPEKYDISIIEYEHAEYKVEPVNDYIHVLPPIEKVETPDHQKKGYQVYHTPEVLINKYIKGDYDLYVSFNYQIPTFLLPEGTKNIAWIHTHVYDLADEKMARERRLQDLAFDKVQKIVTIIDKTSQSIYDLFPRHRDKVLELYNAIDIEDIWKKSGEPPEIVLKKPAIVFVGRLDRYKSPERIIPVLKSVHERNPDVHLYYIGEGEQRPLLEEMTQEYGLEEYIHLLGYQTNPFPIVRQGDAMVHLANAEGFGLGMVEAAALGVPLVATDVGIARVLVNHGKCGKIISTDEEAADTILKLLGEDREVLRRECEKSAGRFALKPYIAKIEELFDSVMES